MAHKIIQDKENFLLNRREIKLLVKADKNLSYDEALLILNQEFKAEPEKVVIKQVKGKFGRDTFLISTFIYQTKEDKDKFEPKIKEKKAVVA